MARIQWAPIVAPDIGTSAVQAQQASGQALQAALGSFSGVLNDWASQRRDANLAEVYARQNAFYGNNDVDGYAKAVADGSLTKGLSYLKASDLAATRDYTNVLRNARNSDTTYEREGIRWDRDTATYERNEANRIRGDNIARQLYDLRAQAMRTGDRTAYNAAMAEVMRDNPDITAQQIDALFSAGDNAVQTFRGDTNFNIAQTRWGWDVEDRNNEEAALALAQKYVNFNGTNEDLMADPEYARAPAAVQARALQTLGRAAPTSSVGSFAGPADMGAHQTTVADTLTGAGLSAPVVAGFLGNFEVEGGYGGALGDGGTASGIAQWRGERRNAFRQRFGKDPHQATIAEQAQFAAWELTTPEGRRVAGISDANAQRIMNARTPQEAATLIDQFYERSDGRHRSRRVEAAQRFFSPREVQGQGTDIQTAASIARSSDRYGPLARNIVNALNDDTPTINVVDQLTTEGGPLAFADKQRIGQLIREIQGRYARQSNGGRLPAAAAAQVLIGSVKPGDLGKDLFRNLTGRSSPIYNQGLNFGSAENTLSWSDVDGYLRQLRPDGNGQIGLAAAARNEENRQTLIAGAQQGRAQLDAARAALVQQEALDLQRGIPNNPVTARMRRQFQALNAQWGSFAADAESQLGAGGFEGAIQQTPVHSGPIPRSFVEASNTRPRRTPYIP